ncbi:MAG: chromate transporter [Ruminococcus sp.]|uniref:chromate transporter n=1 Tax=Ruminococcus sp. TaxID=41978 RepID=UPI001B1CF494|nr:chromate transporter [Ruminococcus sp.]MBO7472718.1 chromate transporter [Ruminococcus sp.]
MALIKLFLVFLKIGAFTFGGGYAMIAMIQAEAERHGWLTQEELVDFVALSESTPGPLAVNMATFVGMRTCGVLGAIIATLGIILPSFIIILIIAKFFETYKNSKAVNGIMSGLKPAVVGMISAAFISVARTVFFPSGISVSTFSSASLWVFLSLFAITVILAFKKVHPINIILLSAVIGIGAGYGLGF